MRVRVQWSTDPATDWQEIDLEPTGPGAQRWRNMAKKPVPAGGEIIDDQPGWVTAVEVDGVLFEGFDHIAVDLAGVGSDRHLRVRAWNDDAEDFDFRWGEVWLFHPHRPDPKFGNRMNTYQTKTVYSENIDALSGFFPQTSTAGVVELRPWSEFPMPSDDLVRHGVWLPDALMERQQQVRSSTSWQDWS